MSVNINDYNNESEIHFREFADSLPQTVFEIDSAGRLTFANMCAYATFGYTREELGHSIHVIDMIVPEDRLRAKTNIARVFRGEKFVEEYTALKKDGTRFPVMIHSSCMKMDGRVIGIRGIIIDYTEQKRAEEELRKLSRAVGQSANAICITDTRGNIEYVNPRFCAVTGYDMDEIVGKNPRFLKSGETPDSEYKKLWSTITSGHEWKGEFHNKRKNGELFWEMVSISPIFNEENQITHFLAVKENITEKKNYEAELIKAKEEAEKSNRLKTEFLAQMSHEIRTPLNSILSFTALLKEELEGKLEDDLKASFKIIDNGGRRLIRTIDLILSMSQLQTGSHDVNPANLSLSKDILENVILDFLNPAKEKKISLNFYCCTECDMVYADSYTVTQIFMNLLDNAIKYTSAGGVEVEVGDGENPGEVFAEVRDTGIGISEEYMPELFKAFSQEDTGYTRKFEGNGLGLALVKKYAELNDADIIVKSKKGKGSSFRVVFKRIDS